jgi:KaiC/GvpD/RAD55 family RecA-like ATPase
MKGVHSDWAYKQLEGAHDGVIDVRVEEMSGQWRNLISIKTLRDVGFDGQWHQLKVGENLEVSLEK